MPTIEELARDMCDQDNAEADACLDDGNERFPYWEKSSEERRDHFRRKARQQMWLDDNT